MCAASITIKESQVNDKFQNDEEGLNIMCEVMLKYEKIPAEDAAKKERIEAIQNMIDFGHTEEKILIE